MWRASYAVTYRLVRENRPSLEENKSGNGKGRNNGTIINDRERTLRRRGSLRNDSYHFRES